MSNIPVEARFETASQDDLALVGESQHMMNGEFIKTTATARGMKMTVIMLISPEHPRPITVAGNITKDGITKVAFSPDMVSVATTDYPGAVVVASLLTAAFVVIPNKIYESCCKL